LVAAATTLAAAPRGDRAQPSPGIRSGESAGFDVLLLSIDSEIEFQFDESPLGGMLPPDLIGVHHGQDAYVRVWKSGLEASHDYRLEPEEVIDLGDRLLVAGRQRGPGTTSGVPFDEPLLSLFTLRRGLVVRLKDFATRDKALQAAGLSD